MNANKKLALNSVIQIIGRVLMMGIGLVSIRLLTSTLGVEGFGEYTTIITYLVIISILADLGLNTILTTEIADVPDEEARLAVSHIFTFRALAAFAIIIGLGSGLIWVFDYPVTVKLMVVYGSVGTFFFSVAQVLIGIFQKHLRTDRLTLADLIARLTLMIGVLIAAFLEQVSLFWVVTAYVLSGVFHFGYMFMAARRYYRFGLAFDWSYWQHITRESLPLFVVVAFNLIYYRIDTFMLSLMQGNEAVGLYGAAYKVLEILITFPGMFVGMLLPVFTRYYSKDSQQFARLVNQSFTLLVSLAVPLVVGGIFLSDEIIRLIAGSEFLPAGNALKVLFFGIGSIFIGNLFSHILIGAKFQRKIMYVSILGAAFNVLLNLYLIPRYSYLGAAFATATTELVVVIAYLILIGANIGFLPRIPRAFGYVLLATSGMALFLYFSSDWNFILRSLSSMAVFGGLMMIMGWKKLKSVYTIDIS